MSSSNSAKISQFFRPKRQRYDPDNDVNAVDGTKKAKESAVGHDKGDPNDQREDKSLDSTTTSASKNQSCDIVDLTVDGTPPPTPLPAIDTYTFSDSAQRDEQTSKVSSSSPLPPSSPLQSSSNPFAMFACTSSISSRTSASLPTNSKSSFMRNFAGIATERHPSRNQRTAKTKQRTTTANKNRRNDCSKEFIRMKELSIDQQELITKKWLSLADDFPPGFSLPYFVCDNHDDTRPNAAPSRPSSSASAAIATSLVDDFIEIRRFQVLVAARLHARCQESSVRKAMTRLRSYFQKSSRSSNINADDGVAHGVKTAGCRTETLNNTITINNIASADPVKLAHGCLSNLQFYNVKAESLVKAAQQIQKEHGGFVPVDEESLLKVTGVGKVFADLLAFVNTRENHLRFIHGALK